MEFHHVHVHVRDLAAAAAWFRDKLGATSAYSDGRMASFRFGAGSVFLDAADEDDRTVVAFRVQDVDAAFRDAVARGAEVAEAPADKPWGVRTAYLKGPGRMTVEFERPR